MSQRNATYTGSDTVIKLWQTDFPKAVVSSPVREWHRDVVERLNELTSLSRGWDGYQAPPVSFDTAHFAMQMLEAITRENATSPQIVPGTSGDLQVEWHTDNGDVELHVIRPGRVSAWRHGVDTAEEGEELALTNDFTAVAAWVRMVTEPIFADAAAA
jgi:hypothetical protein